jgi:hypothetical protein
MTEHGSGAVRVAIPYLLVVAEQIQNVAVAAFLLADLATGQLVGE